MSTTNTEDDSSDYASLSSPINPTIAPDPFNKPNADLILRSSDLVDFRVRKAIMEEATSVFEDMLDIPQPARQNSSTQYDGNVPIVSLTEHSSILSILFQLCYPGPDPEISMDEIQAIYTAARKYMMDWPLNVIEKRFLSLGETEPLRVYAIASYLHLERVMVQAARQCLKFVMPGPYYKELEEIPAGDLYRLLEFRQKHLAEVQIQLSTARSWFTSLRKRVGILHLKNSCSFCCQKDVRLPYSGTSWWITKYINLLEKALMERPSETVIDEIDVGSIVDDVKDCSSCLLIARRILLQYQVEVTASLAESYSQVSGWLRVVNYLLISVRSN